MTLRRLKVLIYTLNYAPEPTGIGKYSGEMAAWLAARGHVVDVICGLPHYPHWKLHADYSDLRALSESLDGVRVWRAPHFIPSADRVGARARIRLETSFSMSAARYWLSRLWSRNKPDVVIAVMPPMQIGVWPLIYGWLRRVPWVLHVQDLQVDAALRMNLLSSRTMGRLLYSIESFLLRKATRVSTITQVMRRQIVAKGAAEEHTWMFPNWADIRSILPAARNNEFRKTLGVGPEVLVVVYAGNMGEKQGLESVLEAAQRLGERNDLLFLMIGGGAARARLVKRAHELGLANLRFLPIQPVERLPEMLAAGDIHLVVQRRDAADLVMPSKLTNIMAAGRPSVVTADEGTALAAVISEHSAGLVTMPEDSAALAEAIDTLAADSDLRVRCGRAARAYAERYLDKERILQDFEKNLLVLAGN